MSSQFVVHLNLYVLIKRRPLPMLDMSEQQPQNQNNRTTHYRPTGSPHLQHVQEPTQVENVTDVEANHIHVEVLALQQMPLANTVPQKAITRQFARNVSGNHEYTTDKVIVTLLAHPDTGTDIGVDSGVGQPGHAPPPIIKMGAKPLFCPPIIRREF